MRIESSLGEEADRKMPHSLAQANSAGVEVEIFGEVFKLYPEEPSTGPSYVRKLALYVDSKMRAVGDETHEPISTRLAMHAALLIAHEYHQSEEMRLTQADGFRSKARPRRSRKPLSEEERERIRERRQRHYTKRSHEKQLLAIQNDESAPPRERRKAIFNLGRVRGYYRGPKTKR